MNQNFGQVNYFQGAQVKKLEQQREENKLKEVPKIAIEPDEMCCVCYEPLKDAQNLTYCKLGCGRQLHVKCIQVWVRH